jgi:hypothetical protein
MKKILMAALLLGASSSALAVAPGGPGCGWGNMLFKGSSGLPMHLLATLVNGTSGNATFGMTTGTNGCSTSGALTYGGKSMLSMNGVMDEVAHDMAAGHGEALTALAVDMGVQKQDRAHFDQVMHQNFATIFPSDDVTAGQVMTNIQNVMKQDQRLSQYI